MKVKYFGQDVEPVSFVLIVFGMCVMFNLVVLVTLGYVLVDVAIQLFQLPARMFGRKGPP